MQATPSNADIFAVHNAISVYLLKYITGLEKDNTKGVQAARELVDAKGSMPPFFAITATWYVNDGVSMCLSTEATVGDTNSSIKCFLSFIGDGSLFCLNSEQLLVSPNQKCVICSIQFIFSDSATLGDRAKVLGIGTTIFRKNQSDVKIEVTDLEAFSAYYNALTLSISSNAQDGSYASINSALSRLVSYLALIRRYIPIVNAIQKVRSGSGRLVFSVDKPSYGRNTRFLTKEGDICVRVDRIRGNYFSGYYTFMWRYLWIGKETGGSVQVDAGYYYDTGIDHKPLEQIILKSASIGIGALSTELTLFIDKILSVTYFQSGLSDLEQRIDTLIRLRHINKQQRQAISEKGNV
jgi:hypothetical protein